MKQRVILLTSFIFILGQILGLVPVGFANENKDISVSVNGDAIYEGISKDIALNIRNVSDKEITDINITVAAGSAFYILGKGDQSISVETPIPSKESKLSEAIQIIHSGSGNELILNISYKIGEELKSTTASLYFKTVPKSEEPQPDTTPVDTSKYKPILTLSGDMRMPTGKGGNRMRVPVSIVNMSQNTARDIVISIENEDESNPITFDSMKPIQTLKQLGPNKSETIYFAGDVDPTVDSGIYKLKVNMTYKNLYGDSFTSSENLSIKIENNNIKPKIVIAKTVIVPEAIKPGGGAKLKLQVRNAGTIPAKDIKISLAGLKSDGFMVQGGNSIRVINYLAGNGMAEVEFDIICASSVQDGYGELDVNIDYKVDGESEGLNDIQKIFIPISKTGKVNPAGSSANIVLEDIKTPGGGVSPNRDFAISFNVKNKGEADASNVKISLDTGENIVPKTLNTMIIPSIKAGESRPVSFTMFATGEAMTMSHPIAINIEYEGAAGAEGKGSAMQYVGVFVDNPDKMGDGEGKSVPRLIIDQYALGQSEVEAGQDIDVGLSFLNTNKSTTIKNLKISFMSDEGVFTTEGSNSFFVDSVSPGSSFTKDITVFVKPDAEPKIYSLAVNLEYEDDKGNPFEAKEFISIPVVQDSRLVLGDLNLSPENYVGQPIPLYIEFYNMGKGTLYNFMIKVDGNFDGPKPNYFVGNFESGRSDSFDANIMVNEPGEVEGKIIFTFEDVSGNQTEVVEDFTVDVMEMEMPPDMGDFDDPMMPPEDEGRGKGAKWGWAIGGSIAAIATFIFIRRRQIKKKGEMFDESL